MIIKPSYSDTATQYSPPPTTATENYSTNLVVPSLPALPTTNTTLHSMQDFNTKATQTDNHNNTLTSVSTQTDNHSRSGALEVNTGFSNNPELLLLSLPPSLPRSLPPSLSLSLFLCYCLKFGRLLLFSLLTNMSLLQCDC